MKVEKIKVDDAKCFWQLQHQLDIETSTMLVEADERLYDIKNLERRIEEYQQNDDLLLVVKNTMKQFVGYVSAVQGKYRRNHHSAYITIGILPAYQGQKIGTRLFDALDTWAKEQSVKRLELTVIASNLTALSLYQKFGFDVEGVKKNSLCIDGQYVNEYYMGKIF